MPGEGGVVYLGARRRTWQRAFWTNEEAIEETFQLTQLSKEDRLWKRGRDPKGEQHC